jgi:ATP-dependent helicase HepA
VCDRADEEGLNLQGGAKAIIHYDLPMAPNRIEQRIGRLDRYGSGDSIRSYVLCCSDDPYQQSWSKCLIDAVGVFSRSIASLQYLIDAAMQQVRSLLLTESHEAMSAMTARLGGDAGEVTQELRRIDHQDALDALGKRPEDALDELFSIDSKWRDFQTTVDDWLVTCLKMSHAPGPSVGSLPLGDSVARYALQRDGRHQTLIPLSRFVGTMLQSLDKTARGTSFRRRLTYAYNDTPLSDILVRDTSYLGTEAQSERTAGSRRRRRHPFACLPNLLSPGGSASCRHSADQDRLGGACGRHRGHPGWQRVGGASCQLGKADAPRRYQSVDLCG